jgi:small subunit ribosomal protein S20
MAKLKTGRHTSGIKAHRQAVTHAEANTVLRSKIHSLSRKVEAAIVAKDSKAAHEALNEAFASWDKAAKTGLIHTNAASRTKSRLSKRVRALEPAKPQGKQG